MNPYPIHQIRKAAAEFGVSFGLALRQRKSWLQTKEKLFIQQLDLEDDPILCHYKATDIKIIRDDIIKLNAEIKRIETDNYKPDAITDEMIARARTYPVENLIEFNRAGRALAFCHSDKSPSLSWWKQTNTVTCFVCSKNFDSIAILTERDGLNFAEAVKRLQ